MNVTQAYQTVEARLTEASEQTPVAVTSPAPTDQGVPTATLPAPTGTTLAPETTPTPTTQAVSSPVGSPCDQAAPGAPIDVTIPDDTRMQPGEEFTKTWRLINNGTCTWTGDYALVWFSGEQMEAPDSVQIEEEVVPGETVEVSVDMEAPQSAGTYISYWKLRNPAGDLFGIGPSGGAAFWVQIIVTGSGTATASPTPGTTTPTVTPTSEIAASGAVTLEPDEAVDLDTAQVDGGEADLVYTADGQIHQLVPQGSGVGLAVFGGDQPDLEDCQTITLSGDALAVDGLTAGTFLCYRTNLALPGWAKFNGLAGDSQELSLEIFTWSIP
jgi:hypothetical protein